MVDCCCSEMWLLEIGLSFNFRWFVALWSDKGEKCNAGKEKPAAAAACNDWSNAAECSWALRRSSATELERGSVVAEVGDKDEDAEVDVGGFIGQQEHNPGKAKHNKNQKLIILKISWFPPRFAFLYIFENQSTKYIIDVAKLNRTWTSIHLDQNISKSYTEREETLLKYSDCYREQGCIKMIYWWDWKY